tara:strand:+ start:162 stop:287 length:126 start_codon:yes stop_codon:yes gene_type:complete
MRRVMPPSGNGGKSHLRCDPQRLADQGTLMVRLLFGGGAKG